jgi:hypothetical protein
MAAVNISHLNRIPLISTFPFVFAQGLDLGCGFKPQVIQFVILHSPFPRINSFLDAFQPYALQCHSAFPELPKFLIVPLVYIDQTLCLR